MSEEFVANDSFAHYLGVEMQEVKAGSAVAHLKIEPHHLNSYQTVHGGVIFSLADAVFAAASNSHGPQAMAINVSISFVKAATAGTLTASAKEISLNHTLATYEVRVTDDSGELIATFHGMVYRKRNRTDNQPKTE